MDEDGTEGTSISYEQNRRRLDTHKVQYNPQCVPHNQSPAMAPRFAIWDIISLKTQKCHRWHKNSQNTTETNRAQATAQKHYYTSMAKQVQWHKTTQEATKRVQANITGGDMATLSSWNTQPWTSDRPRKPQHRDSPWKQVEVNITKWKREGKLVKLKVPSRTKQIQSIMCTNMCFCKTFYLVCRYNSLSIIKLTTKDIVIYFNFYQVQVSCWSLMFVGFIIWHFSSITVHNTSPSRLAIVINDFPVCISNHSRSCCPN